MYFLKFSVNEKDVCKLKGNIKYIVFKETWDNPLLTTIDYKLTNHNLFYFMI